MDQKISVIVPTYNRADNIIPAINSILEQSYPVEEVIIVDDCSSDNTQEVIDRLKNEKVKYYRLPENRGAGGARNYGVEQATYDMIAFHDSDDLWCLDKLEKQMALWEREPDCGLVYTAYRMHLAYGIEHIVPGLDRADELYGDIFAQLLIQNTIGAPTVLMRKSVFCEVGGFDETMSSLEDWDFAIKVAQKYPIGFVPEPLLEVAKTQGSLSTKVAEYYQNRCYILKKYRKYYIEYNLLNRAVEDILSKAKRDGVMEQVEKILTIYLSMR